MRGTLRVIFSSMKLQMKQSFSRSMFKFTIIVSPIFFGLLLGFIYSGKSSEEFVAYVMIGTATTTMWTSISFSSAGDIERERYMGALQQLFMAPESFYAIMLGKVIGNTILGVISMIISFIFVSIIFKVSIRIQQPMIFLLVFVIGVISYCMIAIMLSGFLAISRQTRTLMNCMDFPVYILSGCVFPVDILPDGIRWLSIILSPTYVIRLLRLCIWGKVNSEEFIVNGIGLIAITAIYALLSIKVYKYIEVKTRQDATLEVM